MSFFRSEPMTLCQVLLHTESAFNCLIELGYEGKVQFRNIYDGNPIKNNQYTTKIQRCNELKRIISHLQQEIDNFKIKIVIYPDVDEDEIPEADDLKAMETTLQQIYEYLMQMESNMLNLRQQRHYIYEHLQVLKKTEEFLGIDGQNHQAMMAWSDSVIMHLMKNELIPESNEANGGIRLSYITGTIPVERFSTFEAILWRITHGYFLLKHSEISVSLDKKAFGCQNISRKHVFMIFFIGKEIKTKIVKVCQGFGIKLFVCPETLKERLCIIKNLDQELLDLDVVIESTQKLRYNLVLEASTDLYIWHVKVNKMLMVYFILNHMSHVKRLHADKYLQAECWIPTKDVANVREALILGAQRTAKGRSHAIFVPMLNEIHRQHLTDANKPTYFVLNKFTQGFQNLIDSYGIAQYQELNPAPYTIITFPFLFAVMFGDIGHGFVMFLFGFSMVIKERYLEEKNRLAQEQREIWNILFAGRYIITLMGVFSIYTGFIYNDCFSKSFNIFGSSWRASLNKSTAFKYHHIQLDPSDPKHYMGKPYIFGMDPIWDASGENAITTFNSLKMKLAIILGVAQMIFGLLLSAYNFIYRNNYVDLLLVFVPQITFFLCVFAYLVFLIFFKWLHYGGHTETPYNSACAPSILITFINMLLMKNLEDPPPGCDTWMFESQPYLQIALLSMALLCIPVLLAGKPIYFMIQEKKIQKIKNVYLKKTRAHHRLVNIRKSLLYAVESTVYSVKSEISRKRIVEVKADLNELWIHSGIHCIESILGTVSHSASYLRLWALSLAHDQLSTVLWNMVLKIGLTSRRGYMNSIVLYIVFALWSILTLAILVVMEGLSAFLHTLRLHWVEFQSKFYTGNGESFQPFKFKTSSPNNMD